MTGRRSPLHVTLVATPDAQVSPLSGLYETLTAFDLLSALERDLPMKPFIVQIVAPARDSIHGASGLPLGAHCIHDAVEHTDIVIVPLMMVNGVDWVTGRYPALVEWMRQMHQQGAMLCSTCTGVLLLAETGLLDRREATIHWAFAHTFRRNFPSVSLRTEEVLITAGDRQEFVMTGGVMSWHDLALYLIAQHVGPAAAGAMSRLLMLQWHGDGQTPYVPFSPKLDHGDALVLRLQKWVEAQYMVANPVGEMVCRSGLPRRTLERRFRNATACSPIAYVQHLRIAEAKRRLERTNAPIEQIGFDVGYQNTAFFRRVFRRLTRLTPGAYRRNFQIRYAEPARRAAAAR